MATAARLDDPGALGGVLTGVSFIGGMGPPRRPRRPGLHDAAPVPVRAGGPVHGAGLALLLGARGWPGGAPASYPGR